jgi:maltose alpha-D-glucosyltransferase / alpha-amylase
MAERDPFWFKDAIFYQLHVKAFFDSNNDGVGDFRGLTERLDYIQQLGVDTVWLLPFYPSPLRDDGYDIADYRNVHPSYGNMRDFRTLVREAHARDLKVLTELVINHTSDQHPWFQRARQAKEGSAARNYYVWSDTHERYAGTRIIFTDTEKSNWTWDETAGAYYWHRFFSHQPDLNFDNPRVVRAVIAVMRFWLNIGVDGMRLDAVPYLCEREGSNNENLPETHAVLKRLRAALDHSHPGRIFLAEANQWPEDVLPYFGEGDECHMAFHFPLMPRVFMAIAREDRHPITDIMRQTPEIPPNSQWAIFLRNHDELTLEMVTDRERDYLWETYAKDRKARLNVGIRRRLAPLMDNDRRKIELLNSLLMSMPGTPIIYYGDELGMGDNIFLGDRNGVRTPMQWSEDRNGGFSRADPATLYLPPIMDPVYGYGAVNVEAQGRSPSSLLSWMRRLIQVRRSRKTFGRGSLRFLYPDNRRILAYLREYEGETILCVANLSHSVQGVELDMAEFKGRVPIELMGQSALPPTGELPYFVTLPAYGFYWFLLARETEAPEWHYEATAAMPDLVTLVLRGGLSGLVEGGARHTLEQDVLPRFLPVQRWYGDKGHALASVEVLRWAELTDSRGGAWLLCIVGVQRADGVTRQYFLPLAAAWGRAGEEMAASPNPAVLARLRSGPRVGSLYDAAADEGFPLALLAAISDGRRVAGSAGMVECFRTVAMENLALDPEAPLVRRVTAEQSNTSVIIGEGAVLKLLRRLEEGLSVEVEMGRFLTEVAGFPFTPALLGGLVEAETGGRATTLAMVHAFVGNQGDAWSWATRQLERLLDEASLLPPDEGGARLAAGNSELSHFIEVLGSRTGELHRALARTTGERNFDPEPVDSRDIEHWRQRALDQATAALHCLAGAAGDFPEAGQLLDKADLLRSRLADMLPAKFDAYKSRIHGDYHLGQVLVVKNDVAILDFEGEPARPLSDRRAKDSPLRDIAGMLRSFDYAAASVLARMDAARPGARQGLAPLADQWVNRARRHFLGSYIITTEGLVTLPSDASQFRRLLRLFFLEKACYEICYEVANRPAWRAVPVRGVLSVLQSEERAGGQTR